ncbi:acyl-CoA-binding domain-containing protein 5A [Boleophthalmus pectinirostris]|uniref:acyl-CoA-binding domain-containing protein 5A n=1 Tax=Boleophthalmus pectinirostris TaxID=150288 RepID=UPI000A1C4AB9|nr:acyl-CoA-binding domain-containing protein 5A [Boleophthalmus pectinirostris]
MEVESVSNMEEDSGLTQVRFEAAVRVIKSLPPDGPFQPSNDMMLKFYKFYKQATVGPCNVPRPGFWDAVGKAKWDAWNSLGDMSKEKAMAAYVDEMKLILEGMPMTGEVEELLRVLGPFYELVDEKKKITQISDISAGFGTMMNSVQTKSVAKDIVRSMELNGSLEPKPRLMSHMREVSDEELQEEVEEDDEQVLQENKKERRSPKKKGSARRHLANGKVPNGGTHLTNGNHSRAALNSEDSQEALEPVLNGHHADAAAPNHIASDSDSEVYCDSIDQFGQEENSEHNRSIDDLEEEESHSHHLAGPVQDNVDAQGVQCGGEDGKPTGTRQRPRIGGEMSGSSMTRQPSGYGSHGPGSGPVVPTHSSGDGAGGHWGGPGTPGINLNEQIVVALARLQEDMQSVLERLHTLEALTASQARSMALSPTLPSTPVNKRNRKPSWWPFDISPTSLAFAVIWPFVVQWLLRVILHRRRRRIN